MTGLIAPKFKVKRTPAEKLDLLEFFVDYYKKYEEKKRRKEEIEAKEREK